MRHSKFSDSGAGNALTGGRRSAPIDIPLAEENPEMLSASEFQDRKRTRNAIEKLLRDPDYDD